MKLEPYKDIIIKLYIEEFKTTTEIAKIIGCSQTSVERMLKRNNIKVNPDRFKRKYDESQALEMVQMYLAGNTTEEIAEVFGLTDHTVAKALRRYNVEIRKSARRSAVKNHDYFETIDTPEKAYFLGWMITDGSVVIHKTRPERSPTIGIELQGGDKYIIEMFATALGAGIDKVRTFEKRNHAQFRFASQKMADDLSKYGVVPNKTYSAYIPQNIKEDLVPHMCRGIFDGNGTFVYSNNYPRFAMYGTYELCDGYGDILKNNLDISKTKISKSTYWHTWWNGFNNSIKFYNYIYKDCGELFLKRKKEKMQSVLFK